MTIAEASLLIIEDDLPLLESLSNTLGKRGYIVSKAATLDAAQTIIEKTSFDFYLLDLNVLNESSLQLIPQIKARNPSAIIVIMTGFASIATAVEAIKLGATNYLTKPLSLNTVIQTFQEEEERLKAPPISEANEERPETDPDFKPLSVKRLEWEHIQNTLKANNGNISETARQLNMHRRTLQRKLQKKPAR